MCLWSDHHRDKFTLDCKIKIPYLDYPCLVHQQGEQDGLYPARAISFNALLFPEMKTQMINLAFQSLDDRLRHTSWGCKCKEWDRPSFIT